MNHIDEIKINKQNIDQNIEHNLAEIHLRFKNVFNQDLSKGYNNFAGTHVWKLNFVDETRPSIKRYGSVLLDTSF